MIEVENTDVNIVRNLIPMRNHMPASAYGLKAISDWFQSVFGGIFFFNLCCKCPPPAPPSAMHNSARFQTFKFCEVYRRKVKVIFKS